MSYLKKIIKIIVNVLTCLLLFVLGLIIYSKVAVTFTDNGYPNYFGYTFFEVASGSMEPTLKINDVILVHIGNEDLEKDDIITFKSEDAIITHRVLFIEGNIITVKGDNNNVVDAPITKDQVIGKVVKIYSKLGIWKKVVTEPKILIGIFITLLLFDFALSYSDKKDNKKKTASKKDDIIAREIKDETDTLDKEQKQKKVIESQELLELTRKINIDEINKLLEGTEYELQKKEIDNIKKEVNKIEEKKDEQQVVPKLNSNERKAIEYTMRLDLNQIQKIINSKVK